MSENKARKKALYVNNVSTKEYMTTYMRKHYDSENFSYIVFTYNINGKVHPWNRHGDIFYNGHKLTYINDVCHEDIITDEHSHYLGYFNGDGALDFAQSYIYVSDNCVRDSYSLYSNNNPQIDIVHWTNFRDFVNFESDGWQYELDSEITFTEEDDILHLEGQNLTNSRHFVISYNYHVDEEHYSDKYDLNINLYDPITEVSFFDFPRSFDVGQIYTPKIKVLPSNQLSYYTFKYVTSNTNNIDLNKNTGRFICKYPNDNVTITCCYFEPGATNQTGSFQETFKVNKLNNHLKMTTTYTAYIYGDAEDPRYTYTVCYVHNYPYYDDTSSKITTEFINVSTNTSTITSIPNLNSKDMYKIINYSDYDTPGIYKIGAVLNENIYNSYVSYTEVVANVELSPIDIMYFKPLTNDAQTITGVIVTATNSQIPYTSTNFKFNSDGKYDNFTITDIIHDGNYTYTYITANVAFDTTYAGIIQVSSMDDSFMTYTFEI